MKKQATRKGHVPAEVLDLRSKLDELQATLDAIRSGEVDALIVNGPHGDQVYSLKGAEQPYREFIERMGEGAVTLDVGGTVLYCNRRFAEMVGVPLERVISSDIFGRIAEADREQVRKMLTGREPTSANFELIADNPVRVLPVRIAISVMESTEGELRCAVVTDLTEQKERAALREALEKLQESQLELQKQVREVDAGRKKLEIALAAKDEFLAALSHELRTPLTPVLLTANAIAMDPTVPTALKGDLELIRRNVELEARLIDDLLDLTRITRGKLQVVRQTVDLHETLGLALEICQSDATAKSLKIEENLMAEEFFVSADAVRLQQIFWNLVRNAVKFTPQGGRIEISTRNAAGNGRPEIEIAVIDTGIGIPATAITQIFDAFDQGSTEINRRFGGLGLGLTITRRLVELHGGVILAESEGQGLGAKFMVRLPTVAAPEKTSKAAPRVEISNGRSLRILLVEDHDDTRRNMARLLTALEHLVVSSKNAADALREAEAAPFDLVISDIGLPEESGLDLMKKLSQRHGLLGICLSGYGTEEDIERSREAGFVEHLIKPINVQRLESVLAQVGGRSRNGTASGAT